MRVAYVWWCSLSINEQNAFIDAHPFYSHFTKSMAISFPQLEEDLYRFHVTSKQKENQ